MIYTALFIGTFAVVFVPFAILRGRRGRRLNKEFVVPVVLMGAAAVSSLAAAVALGLSDHAVWTVLVFAIVAVVAAAGSLRLSRRL